MILFKSVVPQAIPKETIPNLKKKGFLYKDVLHHNVCDNSLRISLDAQLQWNGLVNFDKSAR